MARLFLTPINLNKNELQNAVIQNLSTAPSSPTTGQVYYDTSVNQLKVYEGTGWAPVGGVATGAGAPATSPLSSGSMYLDTTNSLLYVSNGTASSANWIPVMPYGLTTDMASLGTANNQGTSLKVSRADHVHRHTDADHSLIHLNALATATGDYSMGGNKLTNVATPVALTDAANKGYVDSVAQGLQVLDSVAYAYGPTNPVPGTYAAGSAGLDSGTGVGATITLTATGATTVDSAASSLKLNERILVMGGTTALSGASSIANGLYTVTTVGTSGVATVLTRSTDYDNHLNGQVVAGTFVFVALGTVYGKTGWVQNAEGTATNVADGIKLGTDGISWTQFSGTGTYTASNGVLLTGTNFTFAPSTTGGLTTSVSGGAVLLPTNSGLNTTSSGLAVTPGLGITITGQGAAGAATTNQVAINTDVVTRKYSTTIGDGSSTSITVTHSLNTRDVNVTLYDVSTYAEVNCDIVHTTVNTVTLAFSVAPASNSYRAVVHG